MILIDTHSAFWALSDPDRLSPTARDAIVGADRAAVAGITWYELAWLIDAGKIEVEPSPTEWLRDASAVLDTLPMTWEIAYRASALSRHSQFPKDPADRLIYATAVAHGLRLVTKDRRLRDFDLHTCVW